MVSTVFNASDIEQDEFGALSLEGIDKHKPEKINVLGDERVLYYLHGGVIKKALDVDDILTTERN